MELVTNNIKPMPIKMTMPMFCFGGCNVSIEMGKVKNMEVLCWCDNDGDTIPVLMITLQDGTKISVDYDSFDEAKKAMNEYKREFIKKV